MVEGSPAAVGLPGGTRRPSPLPDLAAESQLWQAEQRARADAPSPMLGSVRRVASPMATTEETSLTTAGPGDEAEGRGASQWPLPAEQRHAPAATGAGALPAPPARQWEATAAVEGHSGSSTLPVAAATPGGGNDAIATEALERSDWSASASERGDNPVPTVMAANPPAAGADILGARFVAQPGVAAAQTLAGGGQSAAQQAQDNFWQHLQHFRPPGRAADGRPHHADGTLQQLQQENQRQQQRHQQHRMVGLLPYRNISRACVLL